MDILISLVKSKCYQVSDDDSEENISRLEIIMEDAEIKVKSMLGITDKNFDFAKPGKERDLFLNYCFYAWNDKTEFFKNNYLDDIMSIRAEYEVKYRKEHSHE